MEIFSWGSEINVRIRIELEFLSLNLVGMFTYEVLGIESSIVRRIMKMKESWKFSIRQ